MNIKNYILALSLTAFSSSLLAESDSGQNFAAKVGIGRGGLIIGGEYEVVDTKLESFVGFFSLHSKDTNDGAPGLLALGGAFKLTARMGSYEVFFSPGLGIINYDSGLEEDLLIGPRLAVGMHAKLDQYLAIGVENEKLFSWLGEVEGLVSDSFLLTFQFSM